MALGVPGHGARAGSRTTSVAAAAGHAASSERGRASHLIPAPGSLACSRVPSPTGLSIASVPPTVATRSSRPRKPPPDRRVDPADAVVGDAHDERLALQPDLHPRLLGLRVARDVRQRLGDQEVRGGLDRRAAAAPPAARPATSTGSVARSASELIAGRQPAVGEDRGMDAARELAQLGQRASPAAPRARRSAGSFSRALSIRRSSASATSCCCAPSCRLRSIRRRAASPASMIRSRDSRSSSTRACRSACRRSLSSASDGGRRGGLHQLRAGVQRRVVDDRRDAAGRRARPRSRPAPSPGSGKRHRPARARRRSVSRSGSQ